MDKVYVVRARHKDGVIDWFHVRASSAKEARAMVHDDALRAWGHGYDRGYKVSLALKPRDKKRFWRSDVSA